MSNHVSFNNLLSAMAAADLIVMAIYFGALTSIKSWKTMHGWLPPRNDEFEKNTSVELIGNLEQNQSIGRSKSLSMIPAGLIMVALASIIVEISTTLERHTSSIIPGMGCAFVAMFGTILNRVIDHLSKHESILIHKHVTKFKYDIRKMAPPMSDYCFYLLFAAIGTSANLRRAMTYGLPCIAFASLSLMIHVLTIFSGSVTITKLLPRINIRFKRILPLSTEEVCIASNAAIGGASTAAALAGKSKTRNRSGLVIAATFWGIVGYAFSTSIGAVLSRILLCSKSI